MTTPRLRLAFAGTPEIASRILESILSRDEHDVSIVYTQPDRPAGRGRKLKASNVKELAVLNGIPLQQPTKANEINTNDLAELDLMIVVAYGLLLQAPVLIAPKYGCINIHASLLPRWRGAAPIQRAIEAGDDQSGISIMQMDEGLDTGPIISTETCSISENETAGSLHDKLLTLSCSSIHSVLNQIANENISSQAQNNAEASYAAKISKAEAELNWALPADTLERKIRAFNPFPIAHTELNGIKMRIWSASAKTGQSGMPGAVCQSSQSTIDVNTVDGMLSIERLQIPGKKPMSAKDFLNGHPDFICTIESSV